jgi:hypothetical protein
MNVRKIVENYTLVAKYKIAGYCFQDLPEPQWAPYGMFE